MGNWYGIKGIEFIPHGAWSDAEIEYKGLRINSHIVEDTMWERWCEEYDATGTDLDGFADYMRENANEVKYLFTLGISPLAVKSACNWGGVGILYIDDYTVISGENYGDGWTRINKAALRENANGSLYFMRYGHREKISDFMRV